MPGATAVPYVLAALPEGVDAIRATLKYMRDFVRRYSRDVDVISAARRIILDAGIAPKDYAGEVEALQVWVRDHIRYTRDPAGAEMVQTPKRTLAVRMGDCDDQATLLAALLGGVGVPTRFAALGFDGGPYSHVISEARVGTRWVPLETIIPGIAAGWYPPNVTRRMTAHN